MIQIRNKNLEAEKLSLAIDQRQRAGAAGSMSASWRSARRAARRAGARARLSPPCSCSRFRSAATRNARPRWNLHRPRRPRSNPRLSREPVAQENRDIEVIGDRDVERAALDTNNGRLTQIEVIDGRTPKIVCPRVRNAKARRSSPS